MRYALGIDGGGSKCDAALVEETGAVVGWGRGGPTHVYYDPPEVVAASVPTAVAAALSGLRGAGDVELWVAGYLPQQEEGRLLGGVGRVAHYLRADEIETAFASVQEEWGLVVLSGTGSFVHGRTPDGRKLHCGGTGPILNDYGSGYEIGLRALRAAFASHWTPARRTSLAEAVPRALGVDDLRGVFRLVYIENMNRRRIAALARVADEEARAGDRIAADCLRQAADELADLAVEIVAELGLVGLSFPVIAIGGVAQRSRLWWDRVCQRLAAVAPAMRPVMPRLQPATGAALLALRDMGIPWSPSLISRLVETEPLHRPPPR